MSEAACLTEIEAIWTANWARSEPVRWHQNTSDREPDPAVDPNWLQIAVEFAEEEVVAYGGGARQNERRLRGSVVLRGFAQRGRGEDTLVAMMDAAVDVFRSRRSNGVSFVGTAVIPEPSASANGIWWGRTRIASFEYRFRG